MLGRNNLLSETDNLLLAALPKKDYKRLLRKMRQVSLKQGERLIAPGQPVKEAYFPINAMISLVSLMNEGLTVETGVVGNEGMLGIPVLFGMESTPMESVVQIPGTAWKMSAKELKEEFDAGGVLNKILLRYL